MNGDPDQILELARGCRVQARSEDETVLVVPEGLLRLKGAGAEILSLVDGNRTVAQIIERLQTQYPPGAHARIAAETTSFLAGLEQRSVLRIKTL